MSVGANKKRWSWWLECSSLTSFGRVCIVDSNMYDSQTRPSRAIPAKSKNRIRFARTKKGLNIILFQGHITLVLVRLMLVVHRKINCCFCCWNKRVEIKWKKHGPNLPTAKKQKRRRQFWFAKRKETRSLKSSLSLSLWPWPTKHFRDKADKKDY